MQTILTQYGALIPQHTADSLRKKEILPVEYHTSGSPKAVPLEQQKLITTLAGDLPAELVTFHENGMLNRIFPLNGKLSGYWSEADEAGLAVPLTVHTPAGLITAKIISIGFYKGGSLRSITLWPGETVCVETPAGFIETRIGLSFFPDGHIRSVEPARPTSISTPAGEITIYDPDAIGINGDHNSLEFDKHGTVRRFTTATTQIRAVSNNGSIETFSPAQRESYCSESERETIPMHISIEKECMEIQLTPETSPVCIPLEDTLFFSTPLIPQFNTVHTPTCSST